MTPANAPKDGAIREVISQSYDSFKERMEEIGWVMEAKDALAIAKSIEKLPNEDPARRLDLPPDSLMERISNYRQSHPAVEVGHHALNEAAIVLLSAYLEGYIEELHEGAMRQLLDERVESAGVLGALLEYAQERFGNPMPDRIRDLFNTCGIRNVVSNIGIGKSEIERFVRTRNKIAHGEHVNVASGDVVRWYNLILDFAEGLSSRVQHEIIALKSK